MVYGIPCASCEVPGPSVGKLALLFSHRVMQRMSWLGKKIYERQVFVSSIIFTMLNVKYLSSRKYQVRWKGGGGSDAI